MLCWRLRDGDQKLEQSCDRVRESTGFTSRGEVADKRKATAVFVTRVFAEENSETLRSSSSTSR